MISGVFIDRPRLAIVISIVMTLAGLLALFTIPVSQFPDIVPPQVQVTARYPGASAAVVESTVAQPLESAVNGADRMLYMRSNSANDGSYSLTVTFALGTNPDINTVNVNNRVQGILARLPQEVQRNGVTVVKRSAAVLQFLAVYSETGEQDPLFLSNFVTINMLDTLRRVPGVGDVFLFGAMDYSMRIWFEVDRLISLNITPQDIIQAIQAQNVQAAVGRIGARPIGDGPAVPAQHADPGTPDQPGAVRRDRHPRQPGRVRAAGARRGARRARRRHHGHGKPAERPTDRDHGRLPGAGRQCRGRWRNPCATPWPISPSASRRG